MLPKQKQQALPAVVIAALGVVYGDIGTSPLYALKETFSPKHGVALTPDNIVGAVSLMIWALTVVVSIKYVSLILRAGNRGEGGIMALIALASSSVGQDSPWRSRVMLVGLFGAALFMGEGVITPAISVLSAVEGLEVATPMFQPYVVPITVVVVTGLYFFQRHGTSQLGKFFGPVMTLWFVALLVLGIVNIVKAPAILQAINPISAARFFVDNKMLGFIALGAITLAITGAEALYADMGHFGKRPIRIAWFTLVFPSLAFNYLGQGALLLTDPQAVKNPFFLLVPEWGIYPLVVLSTIATVVASQATISGTFSLAKQAIQLGFLPRMQIVHTSAREVGQIYMPFINWLQFALVIAAVMGFGSSSALASAYGISVTGTMLISTVLTFFVIRFGWRYPIIVCIAATGFFFVVDLAFFSANLLKVFEGGWFPLVLGAVIYFIMVTWKRGRAITFQRVRDQAIPLESFLASLFASPPERVPGTAIFLRSASEGVPRAMMHNLMHNKVVHERIAFLTVHHLDIPWVGMADRVKVTPLGHHCFQVDMYFGFKNETDVPAALECAQTHGLEFNMMETSFFLSRQIVIPSLNEGGMALWRERIYAIMSRNAGDAVDYYQLPTNRVIELGTQIEI